MSQAPWRGMGGGVDAGTSTWREVGGGGGAGGQRLVGGGRVGGRAVGRAGGRGRRSGLPRWMSCVHGVLGLTMGGRTPAGVRVVQRDRSTRAAGARGRPARALTCGGVSTLLPRRLAGFFFCQSLWRNPIDPQRLPVRRRPSWRGGAVSRVYRGGDGRQETLVGGGGGGEERPKRGGRGAPGWVGGARPPRPDDMTGCAGRARRAWRLPFGARVCGGGGCGADVGGSGARRFFTAAYRAVGRAPCAGRCCD